MDVYVVTTVMDDVVMGVYSKARKAAHRREVLEREGIAVCVTAFTVPESLRYRPHSYSCRELLQSYYFSNEDNEDETQDEA